MSQLFVHQHVFSLRGQFDVTDINEKPVYSVTGSFLKVPKYFTIYDHTGREIAKSCTSRFISSLRSTWK